MSKHTRPTKSQVKRIADQCGISIGRSDLGQYPTLDQLQRFGKAFIAAERDRLKEEKAELLAALRRAGLALAFAAETSDAMQDDYEAVSAAIAKATAPD